ncbi:MAG: hypothetical protein ACYSVY_22275 [Planctomycetota bacterium]|jgi:hypothetical protein
MKRAGEPNEIAAARIYAEANGVHTGKHYSSGGGGWLFTAANTPICQGWAAYARRLIAHKLIAERDGRWFVDWARRHDFGWH